MSFSSLDRNSREVTLNVYDLHDSNEFLQGIGLGLFHTGVEIQGYEYSFSSQGIFKTPPRQPEFGRLREQIRIGTHVGPVTQINEILMQLRSSGGFDVDCYDLTNRNCNHFTDNFCFALVGIHIPDWVNRAANIGSTVMPSTYLNKQPPVNPALGKGAAGSLAQLGKVSAPGLHRVDSDLSSTTSSAMDESDSMQPTTSVESSIFSWFWGGSSKPSPVQKEPPSSPSSTTASPNSGVSVSMPSSGARKQLTGKQKELLAKLKK